MKWPNKGLSFLVRPMRALSFAGLVFILSTAPLFAKDTRDGSSLERAIIIKASEADAARVESEWMRKLFPQASLSSKGVTCVKGHSRRNTRSRRGSHCRLSIVADTSDSM